MFSGKRLCSSGNDFVFDAQLFVPTNVSYSTVTDFAKFLG